MTARTLYVVVRGDATENDDADVPGIYMVEVAEDLQHAEQREAALDSFHGKTAIGMLEDFEIDVVDEDGTSLPFMDEYDGGLEGSARFLGGVSQDDAPSAVAARFERGRSARP